MDGPNLPFEGESALSGVLPDYAKKTVPAERLSRGARAPGPQACKEVLKQVVTFEGLIAPKSRMRLQMSLYLIEGYFWFNHREQGAQTPAGSMEEQAKLRDALKDTRREEVLRLKIAAGQVPSMNGNIFNGGLQQQQQMTSYFLQQQQMQYFGGGHQIQHQHPNRQPRNSSNGGRPLNDSVHFM